MKKILFLLSFLTSCVCAQQIIIQDFSQGKVDAYDATRIIDTAVHDCRNVYFDGDYIVSKRRGMDKLNTTAIGDGDEVLSQFEYKQSDGDLYHIAQSCTTIYYRQAGSNFTAFILNFSSANPCNYAVFMDTLTIVNGINNMQSWDTSTVFTQESTYQPRFIIVWQNRIWIAGDADERSKVRCSEWLNPSNYTIPSSAIYTDPVVFDINSQDGQKVMGFALSPNGNLMIFKEKSVYEIAGYDRSDFYLRLVISDIGCIDQKSLTYKENVALWLSERGIVGYDGHTIRILSDNISATVDDIQQLQVGSGSFSKDPQGDWEVYSSTDNIDTTTKTDSIILDNALIGNSAYRISNLQRNSTNYFHFCYGNSAKTIIKEDTFRTGIFTVNKTIDTGVNLNLNQNMTDSFVMDSSDNKHLLYSGSTADDYLLKYASATFSSEWSTSTIKTGIQILDAHVVMSIDLDTSGNPHIIFSSDPVSGNDWQLLYSSYSATDNDWMPNVIIQINSNENAVLKVCGSDIIHIAYRQYVSGVRNLLYSSATVGSNSFSTSTINTNIDAQNISLDYDSNDNPYISYAKSGNLYISSYTDTNATWSTVEILDTTDNVYGSYIKIDSNDNVLVLYRDQNGYVYSMRYDNSGKVWTTNTYQVDENFINWDMFCHEFDESDNPIGLLASHAFPRIYPSTATYISEIYDTGFSTYTFQSFNAETTSGDQDLTHYIRTSTATDNFSSKTFRTVTSGDIITVPVGQYIQYKVTFATNVLSNSLTSLDKIDISYRSSASTLHTASMLYDDRIWFAVAISSSAYNDRQLILDSNGAWSDFTSVHGCSSLLNYNGTPYWGSDDGYIYLMDTGESDDGEAIESWIITKAYSMGTLIQQKTLDKIYVIADDSGNWNLTLDYFLDRSLTRTGTFNIDLDQTANLINYKIPITKQLPFYTIQYKLYNNNADEPWDLLGIHTYGRMLPFR